MSDESFMNAAGESHDCILPAKAPNKDRTRSAEGLEGRRSTKENTGELNPSRTQSREIGSRGLEGVREAAKKDKGLRFTALLHHVTKGLLRDSFYSLQRQAAPGVDQVTWQNYEQGLEERSSTSIAGFIGVLTAHNHHDESTYQNLTGGNDHWGSRLWRTK